MSREDIHAISVSQETRFGLIQQLYSFSCLRVIVKLVGGAALVVALWQVVSHTMLIAWLVAFALVLACRCALWWRFHRVSPVGSAVIPWGRWFIVGASATGLLWGLTGVVLFPGDSLPHQFLLALFVSGMAGAAVLTYSSVLYCSVIASLSIIVPFAGRYLYQGTEFEVTLGVLILLYGGILIVAARHLHRILSESFGLRFEKSDLIESLTNEKERVEELNCLLEAEVVERKLAAEGLQRSEQRYRAVVDTQRDLVCRFMVGLRLTFVNDAYCRYFDKKMDDLLGASITESVPEEDRPELIGALETISPTRSTHTYEHRIFAPGGEIRWVHWVTQAVFNDQGQVVEYQAVGRDITDRKRMEEMLEASERRFRTLVETAKDVLWTLNLNLEFTYVSPSVAALLGYTAEEIMRLNPLDTLSPASREKLRVALAEELQFEKECRREKYVARLEEIEQFRKDGSLVFLEITTTFLRDPDGRPTGILGISRDITDRKRMEAALRASEEKYRVLVENANEGIVVIQDGRFPFVNPRAAALMGYPEQELKTRPFSEFFHEKDRQELLATCERAIQGMAPPFQEVRCVDTSGTILWLELNGVGISWKDRPALLCFITDVTARKNAEQALRKSHELLEKRVEERTAELKTINEKLRLEITEKIQAEEALRKSEEKYRGLFEGSRDAIVLVSREGHFLDVNHAFLDLSGYDREEVECLEAKRVWADPPERARWQKLVEGQGCVRNYEWKMRHQDGSIRDCLLTSALRFTDGGEFLYESMIRDITERKQSEEALRESEQRFRTIFESARDCIFLKDADLRYTHINPAMQSLFEAPQSQVTGLTDVELYGQGPAEIFRNEDVRVLSGQVIEAEHTFTLKGREITFSSVKIPIRDLEGNTTGLCGIAREITERKKAGARITASSTGFKSVAMRSTMKQARLAAGSDSLVLLTGESGSGKDYMAGLIHSMSRRSNGPFFSINCAALAPELAESELFGHEQGAFTGAHGRKRGMLELAEGGTLLLNEIGELSLPLQAKLLTFLDTRSLTRVGGEKSIEVNARLIAATNRNLNTEVTEKRFRADLFHRLNVFSLEVPPLRVRQPDIPELVESIVAGLAAKLGYGEPPLVDSRTMAILAEYHWPGNIRELKNVLERAMILTQGAKIGPESIRLLETPGRPDGSNGWSFTVAFPEGQSLNDVTTELKKELLKESLRRSSGIKKKAALLLGISPDAFKHQARSVGL